MKRALIMGLLLALGTGPFFAEAARASCPMMPKAAVCCCEPSASDAKCCGSKKQEACPTMKESTVFPSALLPTQIHQSVVVVSIPRTTSEVSVQVNSTSLTASFETGPPGPGLRLLPPLRAPPSSLFAA